MEPWEESPQREVELRELEARLARLEEAPSRSLAGGADSIALFLERARLLDQLGRDEEARQAYLEVLTRDAAQLQALIGLGTLLNKTGFRSAARTVLARAVALHPGQAAAQANLATVLADEGETAAARAHYQEALRLDANNQAAHQGLAVLLLRAGEEEAARHHARLGYAGCVQARPYRGRQKPISLLVLRSAHGHNVPIEPLIDDRIFLQLTLVAEFFDPAQALPPHELIFNAIGDADACAKVLESAAAIVRRSGAPILNAPERVIPSTRAGNAARMGTLAGVKTARIELWPRAALAAPDAARALEERGFRWPLLLRPPGYHSGEHFAKLAGPADLDAVLASLPGEELLVLEYLDTKSADGNYRKYRAMFIDGVILPLHLAISTRWKVHYYTADMATHAAHRAEDAAFLADMPRVLGARAMESLQRVCELLGLDYGGIDFSLDADGELIVFEANATMIILPPLADERWSYRIAPVERVQRAVREMLSKPRRLC